MVVGKPYIRFKINNEGTTTTVDYNHTWATTVETNKGPINTPVLVTSAAEAYNIFNVNVAPYFAQGATSLIIVRVAADSVNKQPSKGVFDFNTKADIPFIVADQAVLKKTVNGVEYEHPLYYVYMSDNTYKVVYKYKDANGHIVPDLFVDTIHDDGKANIVTEEDVLADAKAKAEAQNASAEEGAEQIDVNSPDFDPTQYTDLEASILYDINMVKPLLIPKKHAIPEGTSLIRLTTLYEGEYDITVSCGESITDTGYYNIYITEQPFGTISVRDGYYLDKIIARINNANFNVDASLTEAGTIINNAMYSNAKAVELGQINIDGTSTDFIVSDINIRDYIKVAKDGNDDIVALTTTEENAIATDAENINVTPNYIPQATVTYIPYAINFVNTGAQSFINGSNGEWDEVAGRIPEEYQAKAHAEGLKALQRIRLAGVFCMYGEPLIQNEYLTHGINKQEPEKGMNNNETCKWRTILLGANASDRTDITSLISKAQVLDNQYVLFLGQGLIDTGFTGDVASMSKTLKEQIGATSDYFLLPYECTQYVAGLRAKLEYYESIFGGQGRKRIRSIGTLDIAPLFKYEKAYEWNPNAYTSLNEAGVLTFTEDYGNITLTDGITTKQSGTEEDEEGVMNILKYAQNAIYDVCLPYIGRNINADLENSINMDIESVLYAMKVNDQSLIDTDEFSAYSVNISLGTRSNQLLGRIYIYLTITPVHALRQIEVEMTVQ